MENDLVQSVKAKLRPKLHQIIKYLSEGGDPSAFAWYVSLLTMLDEADSEIHLIEFSIELSKAAFLGFQYDDVASLLIDNLLAEAESIAHAFTADPMQSH